MARGKSGRVVLEIDPELKKGLYLELTRREKTLKDWFVAEAQNLVYNENQINLFDQQAESSDKVELKNKSNKRKK